jgi:hypothetical protein
MMGRNAVTYVGAQEATLDTEQKKIFVLPGRISQVLANINNLMVAYPSECKEAFV